MLMSPPHPSPGALGRPSAIERELTTGPVRVLLAGPDLRYVRVGHVEAVRRVYVGVRDAAWGTVEPAVRNLAVAQDADGFRVTFDADHVAGAVDFTWRGTIEGRAGPTDRAHGVDVTIRVEMDGVARSSFRTCRTGFCVLHPITKTSDWSCTVEHSDGVEEHTSFPWDVAPHQPFTDVRAMSHWPASDLRATVRFEGEVFETEDQRNWTDSSFKTYCRPLSRPFPYELAAGERVLQAVTIRIRGHADPTSGPVALDLMGDADRPIPAIGTRLPPLAGPLGPTALARLRAMRPAHLRVDVRPGEAGWDEEAGLLFDEAGRVGVPVELALHLVPGEATRELQSVADWSGRRRPPASVCRCIVYEVGRPLAPADLARLARRELGRLLAGAPVGVGTVGSFAELNRNRPPPGSVDLVAYPVNPQVHATDDLSLVENLEAQYDTVATAREGILPRGRGHVAVGPVTIAKRPDPFAAGAGGQELPARPDPRQAGLMGAAWTVGSISNLNMAQSVTYFDAVGPLGILTPEGVTPLYHVLADVGEFAGAVTMFCPSDCPLEYAAVTLRRPDGRARLLVANLLRTELELPLSRFDRFRVVGRLELSEATVAFATRDPEGFRAAVTTPADDRMPAVLRLPPFAVVRLDLEEAE